MWNGIGTWQLRNAQETSANPNMGGKEADDSKFWAIYSTIMNATMAMLKE